AAGEGVVSDYYSKVGCILKLKPSPGPERPTSPASGRGDIHEK
ncbi:MAG: hypothetical protein ACI93T_002613, partial [Porticoccaceae bacterium]